MEASAAGRSAPPALPTLIAGKASSSRSWPSLRPTGQPRAPRLRPARRRPRGGDERGEPHRVAAAAGDRHPDSRRPMFTAVPARRRRLLRPRRNDLSCDLGGGAKGRKGVLGVWGGGAAWWGGWP